MADKIKEGTIIAVGVEYTNEEDKKKNVYVKIPNPKNNVTEEQIKSIFQEQIIGGATPLFIPPDGGTLDSDTAVFTAYREYTREVEYDIGVE